MCGIGGIVLLTNRGLDPKSELSTQLQNAAAAMIRAPHFIRRGPDAQHIEALEDSEGALFGYFVGARLRITDAADTGADLPMREQKHGRTVTFNGEIYNFRALRERLPEFDYRTHSDTEVLLASYAHYGESFVEQLEGMFSFGLFDPTCRQLLLAIDPAGQKPLVYAEVTITGTRAVVFASDVQTLLCSGLVSPKLETVDLATHFALRYLPGARTVFSGVNKLTPGTIASWSGEGKHQVRSHFTIFTGSAYSADEGEQALLASTRQGFSDVVLTSEQPPLYLLSGGVDSCTLVALAAGSAGREPIECLTLSFDPSLSAVDELIHVKEFIQHQSSSAHPIRLEAIHCNAATLNQSIQEWTESSPELMFSRDVFGLFQMMRQIKARGFRVFISGCGPDEILEGYTFSERIGRMGITPTEIPQHYFDASCFLGAFEHQKLFHPSLDLMRTNVTSYCEQVLTPYREDLEPSIIAYVQALNWFTRSQFECAKSDLLAGHFSLEGRKPYYHRDFVRSCFRVPSDLKFRHGHRKYLFRKAVAEKILPSQIAWRPKVAFTTPPIATLAELEQNPALLAGPLYESGTLKLDFIRKSLTDRSLLSSVAEQIIYYNHVLARLQTAANTTL